VGSVLRTIPVGGQPVNPRGGKEKGKKGKRDCGRDQCRTTGREKNVAFVRLPHQRKKKGRHHQVGGWDQVWLRRKIKDKTNSYVRTGKRGGKKKKECACVRLRTPPQGEKETDPFLRHSLKKKEGGKREDLFFILPKEKRSKNHSLEEKKEKRVIPKKLVIWHCASKEREGESGKSPGSRVAILPARGGRKKKKQRTRQGLGFHFWSRSKRLAGSRRKKMG